MEIESRVMSHLSRATRMRLRLTALFIAMIFGIATDFITSLLVTVILETPVGISSGTIAYILLRN